MTAPAKNKLQSMAAKLALGGALVSALGLGYLFLTPKEYQSSASIRLAEWVKSMDLNKSTDLAFVAGECRTLASEPMLNQAITNMNLVELWNKRSSLATTPSLSATRARLRQKLSIAPVADSSVFKITVTSEDRAEAAAIANELARLYLNYSSNRHQEQVMDQLGSLKQKWNEQSTKITESQARLYQLYVDVLREQSTNTNKYYTPDDYQRLWRERADLESKYVAEKNELDSLKTKNGDELTQALSALPDNTELGSVLAQLTRAKTDLYRARLDHPDDSTEVKNAASMVESLSKKVEQSATNTMTMRETEVAQMKTQLDSLVSQLKQANTNAPPQTALDAEYKKASDELHKLEQERDDQAVAMSKNEAMQAIRPVGISAELIEPAEVPARPFVPDRRLGLGTIGAGGLLSLSALGLWLLVHRAKAAAKKA